MRLLIITTLALTPVAAAAQPLELLSAPAAKQGYYLAVAMHGVANANRADSVWLPTWPGWGVAIRLGQEIDERFGLALSLQLGMTNGKKREATLFGAGVEGQLTLADSLVLRAGVGLGGAGVSPNDSGRDEEEISGRFGERYTVGFAYAFFPFYESGSGGLAVNPVAQIAVGPDSDFASVSIWVGVEVGWWLGLPNNQLALDPDEAFVRE
jgi:hypothetical protein